ncbi:hypothetical protein NKR23_g11302 [Pleurostoma richardsiae]|uniref:NADP-dependent oxidoreductase domain-containing protein n=1 Tax=Pleurostoma richardsiae TaxID=41990 RepID=A0AA38VKA2_9PEZI|nr:hypothetical protein NKR23_g11302 [Pleurostoma richardsiae]
MATKSVQLLFFPAPPPPTPLGNYRLLSPNAAVRVSPLAFGTMSLGTAWDDSMGAVDKEQSFKLLDTYFDGGGNFFDTSNGYQNEESEKILGEWMEVRGVRDRCIVATKYTGDYRLHELGKGNTTINYSGNSKIAMNLSVRDSLTKLRTGWIDIFFVHW